MSPTERREARLGYRLVAPAITVIALVGVFPLAFTAWDSLFRHDLRLGPDSRTFVGLANYREAFTTPRVWEALSHTALFTGVTVLLELALGLVFALAMDRAWRGRGLVRVAVLLPWAIPTVVSALLWQYLFDARAGVASSALAATGLVDRGYAWFVHPVGAWVPIVLADVWKTTPFVALLLLAGLQAIPRELVEAARVDGAGTLRRFVHVTLPLLRPALLVALVFRMLDAFRVFDLVYVMTGGGPGTATEPISLYTFTSLVGSFRFGYGSALAVIVFLATALLAWLAVRLSGARLAEYSR